MGRRVNSEVRSNLSNEYDSVSASYDSDGYLTGYTANGVVYTNITYTTDSGASGSQFGGTYRTVTGWTEDNSRNITVSYDPTTGHVSSLLVN